LREGSDEEEEIEEEFELIIENFGYKGKDVVFGVFYQVILVVLGSYSTV